MSDQTKFQVERIALFSDAVFAIAVTLMIIEVKPPHLHKGTSNIEALNALLKLTPMFCGVVLSFIFIGMFWLRHHQLMKYLTSYNNKLLILNMVFLLAIIFIPFSTGFVFENFMSGSVVPMVVYNINYAIAALCNYFLFAYILNPKNGLKAADNPEKIENYRFELLYPIAVYILVILLAVFVSLPLSGIAYGTLAFEDKLNPVRRREKKMAKLAKKA